MRFGFLLGWFFAGIVRILRDKPFVPCQVNWEYRAHFIDPAFSHHDEDDDIAVDTIQEFRDTRYRPTEPRQKWPNE